MRILAVLLVVMLSSALSQKNPPLKLIQTIQLPGVEGRIDHLSVDLKGQRLFIAALGNNTLEVVDLAKGTRERSITGLDEPQGVAFSPDLNRVFVASGGDDSVRSYDASSLSMVANVKVGSDTDNVRYDAAAGTIVVGYGAGALATLDAKTLRVNGATKLSGHPESFQLEKSGSRIYVNVPGAGHIAVVDRTKQSVIASWSLGDLHSNFPMALDEANHRLFAATRSPARLVTFDTSSGKQIAALNSSGDADDLFYDPQSKRVYLIAGEGFIDVFGQDSLIAKVPTAAGARTGLFVPELRRLFIAVPHRGAQQTAIRIYEVQ